MLKDRSRLNRIGASCARPALMITALLCLGTPVHAADRPDDCIVDPDGHETEQLQTGKAAQNALSDCDGLLKPAPVGDRELVEPAPEAGKTPVIEPEEVPVQPSED